MAPFRFDGFAKMTFALPGVYAIAAFSLGSRAREIGIRVALSATTGQVLRPLLTAEWRAISLGLLFGTGGAVLTSRILSTVLFASRGIEPLPIASAALALAVAALAAGYLPARRALRADPLEALRTE